MEHVVLFVQTSSIYAGFVLLAIYLGVPAMLVCSIALIALSPYIFMVIVTHIIFRNIFGVEE